MMKVETIFTNCGLRLIVGVLITMLSCASTAIAQRYPATTTIQLIPPYSNNLEQYAIAGSDRLLTSVVFNDFSQPSWNVKFRLTITSGSIQLRTHPDAVLPAVNLVPGVPEQLTGFDLADYLSYNNMTLAGITLEDLARKGGLPDGNYTFTFEALDHRTGIAISNVATANAWLIQNDPPQIMFPACGERVPYTDPQNIPIQWLPMHLSSPNSSFNTEYELTLVEMPEGINANEAILSGMPVLNETVNSTNFLYSATEPLLQNGKSYAYRIRATDTDNLGLFKNDGYSQVCWFTYGYSTGGTITTVRPADNALLNVNTTPVFSWNAPNNLGIAQLLSYELKVFELADGMEPAAAVNGAVAAYELTTAEGPSLTGFAHRLEGELDPQKSYVWQVKAFTSGIEIAASQPQRFSTTPVIQEFNAGPHIVRILSISNQDLENFTGRGRVKVGADGAEAEFGFAGVKIIAAAGRLIMTQGEITIAVPEELEDIELSPTHAPNGAAFFRAKTLRIDNAAMSISGSVEWALPFPLASGQQAWVRSETQYVNFDSFSLNGYVQLSASNNFALLDPLGFTLNLLQGTSNFYIRDNQYTQNFDAEISLPAGIKSEDNAPLKLRLTQTQQLFSNEVAVLEKRIVPVQSIGIRVLAKQVVIDLSELTSPERMSADPGWKGIYFRQFDVEYLFELGRPQLTLTAPINHSFMPASSQAVKGWIDAEGLDLAYESRFDSTGANYARFNTFPGKLSSCNIAIEDGTVLTSWLRGNIYIPILPDQYHDFVLRIGPTGFNMAYLDDDSIEGAQIVMTSGGDKVTITLGTARFLGNECISAGVAFTWKGALLPVFAAGFNIYGDGSIGFGKRGGKVALPYRIPGVLNGYGIHTTGIGAGYFAGKYFVEIKAEIMVNQDLTNDPISYYAYTTVDSETTTAINAAMTGVNAGLTNYNLNILSLAPSESGGSLLDSIQVKMDVFLGRFEGYLKFTEDDPDWGDSWQGSFLFELRIPVQSTAEAAYVAGKTPEGIEYWLLDIGMAGVGPDGSRDASKNASSKAGGQIKRRVTRTRSFQQDASVAAAPPPSAPSGQQQPTGSVAPAESAPPSEPGGKSQPQGPASGGTQSESAASQGNLNLGPIMVTGFDLRVYRHMTHGDGGDVSSGASGLEMTFEPSASVEAGVYGRVALVDGGTGGGVFKLDMAFEYAALGNGKGIYGFEGNMDVTSGGGNFTGTGKLTYNEDEQHWLGDMWMVVAMPDKLCLEAGLSFDVSPRYWKLGIGSPQRRVIVTPKCQGWSPTGYFIIDAREFELGLGIAYVGSVSSPEVNIVGNTFQVSADLGFAAGAVVGIQYQPTFAFKKAGVWVEAWGAASVNYNAFLAQGTWTFASVKVAGRLTMSFEDQTRLEGVLSGDVELIGMTIDFQLPMNHTL